MLVNLNLATKSSNSCTCSPDLKANIYTSLIKHLVDICHLKPVQIFLRLSDCFAHFLNYKSQELDTVHVRKDLVINNLTCFEIHFV